MFYNCDDEECIHTFSLLEGIKTTKCLPSTEQKEHTRTIGDVMYICCCKECVDDTPYISKRFTNG
jgi:hypothetical protein